MNFYKFIIINEKKKFYNKKKEKIFTKTKLNRNRYDARI